MTEPTETEKIIAYIQRVEEAMTEEGPRTAGAKTALRQLVDEIQQGKHLT